jgi:hypothetical protein
MNESERQALGETMRRTVLGDEHVDRIQEINPEFWLGQGRCLVVRKIGSVLLTVRISGELDSRFIPNKRKNSDATCRNHFSGRQTCRGAGLDDETNY